MSDHSKTQEKPHTEMSIMGVKVGKMVAAHVHDLYQWTSQGSSGEEGSYQVSLG